MSRQLTIACILSVLSLTAFALSTSLNGVPERTMGQAAYHGPLIHFEVMH